MSDVVIEPAISEDLDELSSLLGELFSEESDFRPNKKNSCGCASFSSASQDGSLFCGAFSIVGMINFLTIRNG
jgi:hypothetical protein